MKRKLLERNNKFIAFLLSILGIGGACSFGGCEYGTMVEYGTPNATYKISGKVTSKESTGIRGIQVILQNDTAHTNENGQYNVQTNDFPGNKDFVIEVNDVDGESNGNYQSMDTIVSFIDPEFKNPEGNWYRGETTKEVNIELKDKN